MKYYKGRNPNPKKKPRKKKPEGRPTKYSKRYCKEIIKYFQEKTKVPYKVVGVGTTARIVANPLPFLYDFSEHIGVTYMTVTRWVKKYSEFCDSLETAREIRKNFMVNNGMAGLYPTGVFTFVAKNLTDMKDQQDIKHSGEVIVMPTVKVNGKSINPDIGEDAK